MERERRMTAPGRFSCGGDGGDDGDGDVPVLLLRPQVLPPVAVAAAVAKPAAVLRAAVHPRAVPAKMVVRLLQRVSRAYVVSGAAPGVERDVRSSEHFRGFALRSREGLIAR